MAASERRSQQLSERASSRALASSRGSRRTIKVGTSLSNNTTGGVVLRSIPVSDGGVATKLPSSGHDVNVSDAMVCDPPVYNPPQEVEDSNSKRKAERHFRIDGNAKERVDHAGPSQENSAGGSNCNPGYLGFNSVSGEVRSDFTRFAMSLPTKPFPVEGGENNFQAHRTLGVSDIIRCLEETNAEIRRENTQHIEALHTLYRSQTALLTDKHQHQVTAIESLSVSEKQELSLSLEGVTKELRGALGEVKSMKSKLSLAVSELQDRNNLLRKMQQELDEVKDTCNALIKSGEAFIEDMNAKKVDLETKLSASQEEEKRKARDVHRLSELLQEKDEAIEEMQLSFKSQTALLISQHQQQVTVLESGALSKVQELSLSLEGVSKELSDARGELSSTKSRVSTAESELQDRKELHRMMQHELNEVKTRNNILIKSGETFQKEMNAKKADLEIELINSQESEKCKDREVLRLNSIIQEKDKAIGELQSARSLLTSEYEKLKAQVATIELQSAHESSTSGSFADDQWILIA